jgi:hypothetical protein
MEALPGDPGNKEEKNLDRDKDELICSTWNKIQEI